jgi:hypothetical protein
MTNPAPNTNSTSSVREWRNCRRRYRYKYVDRIRPATKSKALNVGSGHHEGLEQFAAGATLNVVLSVIDDFCSGGWWDTEKGQVEHARTRAMARAYYAKWADDRQDWEVVEVEGQFEIDIVETSKFVGKKDAVLRYKPTSKLYLWESKTTSDDVSTVGADFWQRLALDTQTTAYRESVATTHGELPGIMYDVVRKPAGKPRMKIKVAKRKSETVEEFEQRKANAYETIEEFEQRLVDEFPDDYLIRREVFKTRQDTDGILTELRETLTEMDGYQGTYPRNDSACKSFGSTCPYLGVCVGAESLDSARFTHSTNRHPELSQNTNQEDVDDIYSSCPL